MTIPPPIHITITCTDCFKGVSFCSGNPDNCRVVYEKGTLRGAKSGLLYKLTHRNQDKKAENKLAREKFEEYLAKTFNSNVSALSPFCGEGDWKSKVSKSNPLTFEELAHLEEVAHFVEITKSLSPTERKELQCSQPVKAENQDERAIQVLR